MKIVRTIKQWFLNRFLPMWAKETVLAENKRLQAEVLVLREKLREKDAYISGMAAGMRSQRRIVIKTTEEKK